MSLTQKLPQRSSRKYISFRIYKVSEEYLSSEKLPARYIENALNLVEGGSGTFYNAREVRDASTVYIDFLDGYQSLFQVTLSCDVPEGNYCIVPHTLDSDVEREFLLRIWTNSRWKCELQEGKVETETDYKVIMKNKNKIQKLKSLKIIKQ